MGRSGAGSDQENVKRFRVERIIPADTVPNLTEAIAELRGKYVVAIADLNGPITNYSYRPEEVLPHMDAIRDAIESQRVYTVETDSTAMTWPHSPDPRGYIDERILRAIVEQRITDKGEDPSPR